MSNIGTSNSRPTATSSITSKVTDLWNKIKQFFKRWYRKLTGTASSPRQSPPTRNTTPSQSSPTRYGSSGRASWFSKVQQWMQSLSVPKIVGIAILLFIIFYWVLPFVLRFRRLRHRTTEYGRTKETTLAIMSPAELQYHDGVDAGQPLYLAVLGEIYDVTPGRKYYGRKTKFADLLGHDASGAFATGRFTRASLGLDLTNCTDEQLLEVFSWRDFFKVQKKYPKVGVLADKYYSSLGWVTSTLNHLEKRHERALDWRDHFTATLQRYEPCTATETEGSDVYVVECPRDLYIREFAVSRPKGEAIRRCVCARELQFADSVLFVDRDCGHLSQQCSKVM